jgi:hypothetical protein
MRSTSGISSFVMRKLLTILHLFALTRATATGTSFRLGGCEWQGYLPSYRGRDQEAPRVAERLGAHNFQGRVMRPLRRTTRFHKRQLIQRDRQVAHAFAGRAIDRVGDRGGNADDANLVSSPMVCPCSSAIAPTIPAPICSGQLIPSLIINGLEGTRSPSMAKVRTFATSCSWEDLARVLALLLHRGRVGVCYKTSTATKRCAKSMSPP